MAKSQFSNDKLKSIARKLEPLIPHVENPSDVFKHFMKIYDQQREYFSRFVTSDFIKIVIYIWSIKDTNSTDYGDTILENIFFVGLIQPSGEKAQDECDYCDGRGEVPCDNCDEGLVECDVCDGDQFQTCGECDGTGEISLDGGEMEKCEECDGTGDVECEECNGRGTMTCPECHGSERETCRECDGDGHMESDDDLYWDFQIAFWNKNIFSRCELTLDTLEPTFTIDTFEEIPQREMMVIFNQESSSEFRKELEEGDYYCYEIDDSPDLGVSFGKFIVAFDPTDNKHYFK